MHIIAVDDERSSLNMLKNAILSAVPGCTLHCFSEAKKAIEHAGKENIDVAFLDIEMPEMTGLALAKSLKDIRGKTNILFVTGHSQYAVDAFSLAASGYILKPVDADAVALELNRLRSPVALKPKPQRVYIRYFGNFTVYVGGRPLPFTRTKAKELLALLVQKNGAFMSNAEIAAVLWEDKPYDLSIQSQTRKARAHLLQTLKQAGVEDIILKEWNRTAIDVHKISCDYHEFLQGNVDALNAYTGEFMGEYSWAEFTIGFLNNIVG